MSIVKRELLVLWFCSENDAQAKEDARNYIRDNGYDGKIKVVEREGGLAILLK